MKINSSHHENKLQETMNLQNRQPFPACRIAIATLTDNQ